MFGLASEDVDIAQGEAPGSRGCSTRWSTVIDAAGRGYAGVHDNVGHAVAARVRPDVRPAPRHAGHAGGSIWRAPICSTPRPGRLSGVPPINPSLCGRVSPVERVPADNLFVARSPCDGSRTCRRCETHIRWRSCPRRTDGRHGRQDDRRPAPGRQCEKTGAGFRRKTPQNRSASAEIHSVAWPPAPGHRAAASGRVLHKQDVQRPWR